MPDFFLSTVAVDAPIHDITWFPGFFEPIPSAMEPCLAADAIIAAVAPELGPRLVADKHCVLYFVPARLRQAPYVGKTAERHPGESGFQRSSSHVAHGSWFAFDLDGLDAEAWTRVWESLATSGAKFAAYTSYSHGAKPGVRVRVVTFVDRPLNPVDWARAWGVVNERLLLGLADKKTGHLAQPAGVWATHPSRASQSFHRVQDGALLSADALLAQVPQARSRTSTAATSTGTASPRGGRVSYKRLGQALSWLDPEDYETWTSTCLGLQAAVRLGHVSDTEGQNLWLTFSDRADERFKARNTDNRYNPEVLWARMVPTAAPLEALFGGLLARARDEATRHIRNALAIGSITPDGQRAARYLGQYHPRAIEQILGAN